MFAKRRRRRPLAGLFFAGALPATGNPCILKRILEQKISAELSDIENCGTWQDSIERIFSRRA
jgi:hypothetical protein